MTGGARGIGEGVARVFFAAGARVLISDRDGAGAAALARELNASDAAPARPPDGARARARRADVSVVAELAALVDDAVAAFGRIDCVVNNAGWHPPHKPIDDFSVDDLQVRGVL